MGGIEREDIVEKQLELEGKLCNNTEERNGRVVGGTRLENTRKTWLTEPTNKSS